MTSMKTRILTAVIAIPLLVIVLFFGTKSFWVITTLISAISAFMTGELLTAKKLLTNFYISIPCIAFSFALPLFSHTPFMYVPVFVFILALFIIIILKTDVCTYDDLSFAFTGSVIIAFGMSCLSYLCAIYESYTAFFMVITLAVPWMADAGAYFAGTFLGKHKLCPKISPKKTVEGFFGGAIFCVIGALLIGVIFANFIYENIRVNYISLLIIGVLDSVVSVVGDLCFSIMKRHCKIKDYGSIFPGHGGMLDRCDSVIFTAPLILLVNQLLPIIS